MEKERVMGRVNETLSKGRAVATGIGVFGAVLCEDQILLRKRMEKGSLIYNGDLSGKWELPGGGVDLSDTSSTPEGISPYQGMILMALDKELREEVCLRLNLDSFRSGDELAMFPAWLAKEDIFDLAFVIPLEEDQVASQDGGDYFSSHAEGIESGAIRYFSEEEISSLEIISPRMRFMIAEVFRIMKKGDIIFALMEVD